MSQTMMQFEAQKKSAGIGYVLWFFLGGLGAHRFYAGKWLTALLQAFGMVIGIFAWIFLFGAAAAASNDQGASEGLGAISSFLFLLWGIATLWILIDVFFIGRWIRKHNMALAEKLGQLEQITT